jgi:PAS domain S-box-containing protein
MQILFFVILLLVATNIFFIVLYYQKKQLLGSGKINIDTADTLKFGKKKIGLPKYRRKLERLVEEKERNLEFANHELVTLNKELDTSNEELQAMNEELNAINEELDNSNKALIKEIEEHKKTQAKKDIIEEKLNQFISQSSEAIIIINDKGIVEDWNTTMAEITGITKENALGKCIWDVTYMMANDPDNAEFIRNGFKNNTLRFFEEIKQGNRKEQASESQIRHSDSSYRYIRTTLFPIVTFSGNYGGVIISDITQKKAIEAQLEMYKNELEKLLEQKTEHLEQLSVRFKEVYAHSSDAITFLDIIFDDCIALKVFDMNTVAQKLFSVNTEQIEKGVFASDFIPKANYEVFMKTIFPSTLAGNSFTVKEESELSGGYWLSTIIPIKDKKGKVYRIAIFSKDITQEHEREKTVAILQSAIDSWPFEFWARDNEGRQILQNKISKEKAGNLIGKKIEDFDMPNNFKNQAISLMQKVLSGESISFDFETSVSGQKRYVVYKLNPIISNNKINGYTGLLFDITQQKLAEIALQESEKRLSQLLASVTDYKFTVEFANGKIVNSSHSEGCMAITGYSPDELRNNRYLWFKMAHEDDKLLITEWSKKVEKGIEVEPFEHRIIRKNSDIIWVSNTTVLKKDSQGNLIGFDGLVSDITKRKNAEIALIESEEQYRLLAENINDVIWKFDINTLRYSYFSPSIFKLTGYTVKEALELSLEQILMPDSFKDLKVALPEWINQFIKGKPESQNKSFEYQLRHKSGFEVWVEINATLITDANGNIHEVLATSRNINERISNNKAIKESEERFRTIAQLSQNLVYEYYIEKNTIFWDGAIKEVTGFEPEEYKHIDFNDWINFIHPEDKEKTMALYYKSLEELRPYKAQYRHKTKNGTYKWVEEDSHFVEIRANKPYRMLGMMRDITEQLRVQSLIKESEEKLRTIFNTSKDGIVLLSKNFEVFDINNTALKRSGYSRAEIIGKNVVGFLIKNEPSTIVQHILSIWEKDVIENFETEVLIKNNGSFPVEISATALHIDKQEMLLLMIRDISERRQLEKQLLHSVINTEERERIHFSQELHDGLGPLLSAAKMYIEWLADLEPDVDPKIIVQDIHKLLEESTRTVRDISFKLSPHVLKNYGIVEALNAYAEKAEKSGKIHIAINAVNIGRFDEIMETILFRVISECINNSLKHSKATTIIVSLNIADAILCVDFTDDGIGFDVNTIAEKHKGIGLLNIQSRLKSINGEFAIQSAIGYGTNIWIKVPLNA